MARPQNIETPASATLDRLHPAFRILVVDDDLALLKLNACVLRRSGHNIETAEDGAIAWGVLQKQAYDLLITDFEMPMLSGLELVTKVGGARMALPVIMASGALPTLELERSPWLQPIATLVKPFASDQLLATVNTFLPCPRT